MDKMTQAEAIEALKAQGVSSHRHYATKCARCGTVQSMASLVDAGADPEKVDRYFGFSCEGRFNGAGEWPNDPGEQAKRQKRGCNWTLGGLLTLHKFEIELPDGETSPMFEIATPEEAQSLEAELAVAHAGGEKISA